MLLDIRPRVGQVPAILGQDVFCSKDQWHDLHFAVFGPNVGKCIEDVRQLVGGQILWVVVAAVNCLWGMSTLFFLGVYVQPVRVWHCEMDGRDRNGNTIMHIPN